MSARLRKRWNRFTRDYAFALQTQTASGTLTSVSGAAAARQPEANIMTPPAKTRWGLVCVGLALIVALAVIAKWRDERQADERKERAWGIVTRQRVESGLNGAVECYREDMGCYPTADDGGLMALVEAPETISGRWHGPYAKVKQLQDAWRQPLVYKYPGEHNPDGYDLASVGSDGKPDTADDIVNWDQP